jgi:hypothetical protein
VVNSNTGGKISGKKDIARGPQQKAAPAAKKDGPAKEGDQVVFARIVDEKTQQPISGAKYEVVDEKGTVLAQGKTDWQGTVRHNVAKAGNYTVRVTEVPEGAGGGADAKGGGSSGGGDAGGGSGGRDGAAQKGR